MKKFDKFLINLITLLETIILIYVVLLVMTNNMQLATFNLVTVIFYDMLRKRLEDRYKK